MAFFNKLINCCTILLSGIFFKSRRASSLTFLLFSFCKLSKKSMSFSLILSCITFKNTSFVAASSVGHVAVSHSLASSGAMALLFFSACILCSKIPSCHNVSSVSAFTNCQSVWYCIIHAPLLPQQVTILVCNFLFCLAISSSAGIKAGSTISFFSAHLVNQLSSKALFSSFKISFNIWVCAALQVGSISAAASFAATSACSAGNAPICL